MTRKVLLAVIVLLLGWGFWVNPTIKEVGAGIAILLFGMITLEQGFNAFVAGTLRKVLKHLTNRLYKTLGIGFLSTAILQSSSLISVITISFISAGLIDLYAGVGIVFGANIGTTATAWLVAILGLKIKVSVLAMPMIAFGILFVLQNTKTLKGIGQILAGLGFFFLGIHYMKTGFEVYQDSIQLAELALAGVLGLIVYTIVGIFITLILQSSSAAMTLILTTLAVGHISYENALALAIGANVGTTITAIIGSLTANIEGKRLAGAHFIFNVITGIIALVFIQPIGDLVDYLAMQINIAQNNYTLKLAIFHSIFNLIGLIVMLPFIKLIVLFLINTLKEKPENRIEYPKYLNKNILEYPQTALHALLNESKRLFEKTTFEIIGHSLNLHQSVIKGNEALNEIVNSTNTTLTIDVEQLYSQKVKTIYSKIIKYSTLAQSKFLHSPEMMESFTRVKIANRNIVEMIKATQGLRKNINQYGFETDNENIKNEYNKLRQDVSKVLRAIYIITKEQNPSIHVEKLEQLKQKLKQKDVLFNGTIEELIKNHEISSKMATSLVNDNHNVLNIIERLIETTELLYIENDYLIKEAKG